MNAEQWQELQKEQQNFQLSINSQIKQNFEKIEQALTNVSIGSKKLLRLLYIKKVEGIIILPPSTQEILIETLEQSQAAFYDWDVICLNDAVIDVYITSGIVGDAIGAGIQCSLLKRRNSQSPDEIDVILLINNNISGNVTLAYKVYRKAGLD